MTRWILAAEADKIQDLVFRSAHLREVVGGSQLLTRFCLEGAPRLLARQRKKSLEAVKQDILVADGGSFTILFNDKSEANRFGQSLTQLYRATTGSTLTVAKPVRWEEGSQKFEDANERARRALAWAKREGRQVVAVVHLPYAAFCASCGQGLAYTHEPLHERERANYLCLSCRDRADEVPKLRKEFTQAVLGGTLRQFELPTDADKAAEGWDPRQYVAYLVADGNSMGMIFDRCVKPTQMKQLSERLTEVLIESLASPTQKLMARAPGFRQWEIPMLPLILGGDDVFVRLPAPYALDFARCFCWEYEERMGKALKEELGLGEAKPTMAAAVIICKSKYPHTLAHRHGEILLQEAKRLSKAVALDGPACSVVNFDVILGSRIAKVVKVNKSGFHATLRPYWVTEDEGQEKRKVKEQELQSLQVGLSLRRLIQQRYDLCSLPARRLAQLRALYAPDQLPTDESESLGRWQARREQVISRVARSSKQVETLRTALTRLGGQHSGDWYYVNRPGQAVTFNGHGLPDLLEMWDFCLDLEIDRSQYEEGEE